MSAAEKLKALVEGFFEDTEPSGHEAPVEVIAALPQILAVVEAAERGTAVIAAIRALGFVGNAHYCPDCMNHFHDDCGQHEPNCSVLAAIREDDEWWSDRIVDPSLAALDEKLNGAEHPPGAERT